MRNSTTFDRRSVGVRYWHLRGLPFIAIALLVAYVAYHVDRLRGEGS